MMTAHLRSQTPQQPHTHSLLCERLTDSRFLFECSTTGAADMQEGCWYYYAEVP